MHFHCFKGPVRINYSNLHTTCPHTHTLSLTNSSYTRHDGTLSAQLGKLANRVIKEELFVAARGFRK